MKLKLSTTLVAAWCASGMSVGAANANVITTFDVSATLLADSVTSATCSPTCTLGGSFQIDVTTGSVLSTNVNIFMSGETPSVGPFTIHGTDNAPGNGSYTIDFTDAAGDILLLNIPNTLSLVGYQGGSLGPSPYSVVENTGSFSTFARWYLTSGSLTPEVSAPIPAVGAPGLALILGGGGLLAWWRRRRQLA